MIKHIVLLELAEHVKSNEIDFFINKLSLLMKTSIPQIKSISHGKSCSIENIERGYNYAFMMEFETTQDRDFYIHHADHKKIAGENILPLLKKGMDSVLVFDF
jgi:Stress responsive A/B Barrel Domain